MSDDLKRRHERALADELLHALRVKAAFSRLGNDLGEPDTLYTLDDGGTLGIEVAAAYYSDDDARADWTLARGVRSIPDGVEVRTPMMSPDDLICDRVRSELLDKAQKRYIGADHIWLVIR